MPEYLAPGVYIEELPGNPAIQGISSSTGAMVGVCERGPLDRAFFCTSWESYLSQAAQGVATPFLANSDLAYSVYGFFQNGGTRLYVKRVATAVAQKANMDTANFGPETPPDPPPDPAPVYPTITAKDEGAWGNTLTLSITINEDIDGTFDLNVAVNNEIMENWVALSNDPKSNTYWVDTVNAQSAYVTVISGDMSVTRSPASFSGGMDGMEGLADDDFIKALSFFDTIDDITLIAVPGQTTAAINDAVISYAANRKDLYAFIDAPRTADTAAVRALRKTLSGPAGLYYPWIRIADPLSALGRLRDCPASGHSMGATARIIQNRGVWKAAAGTEATLRGALEVTTVLTKGDMDVLNPIGVICIIPKTNYGIVLWGARTVYPDASMPYTSDLLLDIYIKKSVYLGTQQFVFEPNGQRTWTSVQTTVEAFLDTLWRDGGLAGTEAAQAYRVRCDAELNPEASRNQGKLICEVAYAPLKPSEFVIFRFSHSLAQSV